MSCRLVHVKDSIAGGKVLPWQNFTGLEMPLMLQVIGRQGCAPLDAVAFLRVRLRVSGQ